MNTATVDKKIVQAGRYGSPIKADANGDLPTRIEVMRAGSWPETSNKGMLYITPNDLEEFAANFKKGIGIPGGTDFGQIPIDFGHDDGGQAAGWITDLTTNGLILYATVTWTAAGEAALKGGQYKCFSPSFWPACLGEWCDPEDWNTTATNVLVGGGLTNIPFFKDLTPIMASNAGNGKDRKIIATVNADKEYQRMTLDEVRILDPASLNDEQKKVLADNKSQLSAEELKKFNMEAKQVEAPKVEASAVTGVSDEDKVVLASIKAGENKVVKASEWEGMKEAVQKLTADNMAHQESQIKQFVTAEAKKGKIKADQVDQWVGYIKANADMKAALEGLPVHASVQAEKGSDKAEASATSALEGKIAEAMKADNSLTYSQAALKVAAANVELTKQHDAQLKN